MIYFTGDQHFGHERIIEYCGRPFQSVDEMDTAIVQRFCSVVTSEDAVFDIGDFCFPGRGGKAKAIAKTNSYLAQMPCNKRFLILGNHDDDNACRGSEWNGVYSEWFRMTIDGIRVQLQHRPVHWPDRFALSDKVDVVLRGHTHQKPPLVKRLTPELIEINVGVDQWNFAPVAWETIRDICEKMLPLKRRI